jgi:aspartate ammonia-lyase
MKTYYGAQTQAALKNFPFSSPTSPAELITAFAEIKYATAEANYKSRRISKLQKEAICQTCQEIIAGKHQEQFSLPALQGGAGTSLHMNVNEVIAGRANEILQSKKVLNQTIHPNDHVNLGQSTNDANPSALKIASYRRAQILIKTLENSIKVFEQKAKEFSKIKKLGRTHLQDAVTITLGQEFETYSAVLKNQVTKIRRVLPELLNLGLGGTAVGNSINAPKNFRTALYISLKTITKLPFKPAENLMSQISTGWDFLTISSAITETAASISKIANDLRFLASGPKGSIGEISLKELQQGSSIMPGKVNPVLLEALNQVYFLVSGNNQTIELATQAAQLQLSVMGPVITFRLLESLTLLEEVLNKANEECFSKIVANPENCFFHLENSTALATLFTPSLGYESTAKIVKESLQNKTSFLNTLKKHNLLSEKEIQTIINS